MTDTPPLDNAALAELRALRLNERYATPLAVTLTRLREATDSAGITLQATAAYNFALGVWLADGITRAEFDALEQLVKDAAGRAHARARLAQRPMSVEQWSATLRATPPVPADDGVPGYLRGGLRVLEQRISDLARTVDPQQRKLQARRNHAQVACLVDLGLSPEDEAVWRAAIDQAATGSQCDLPGPAEKSHCDLTPPGGSAVDPAEHR